MPIMRGPSDLDKRLKILRSQVYGGNQHTAYRLPTTAKEAKDSRQKTDSDITYLKQDLLKISILATSAMALQFLLYFVLRNNFVKLPI